MGLNDYDEGRFEANSYGFNIGLSFTFGSMFSNVVNPRFE
jgi:hypothetical protein